MDTFFIQILTIITGFISFILVLRSWFQFCRVPVHLPISQTLLRMTAPVVDPLTRIIPTVKGINFAAILLTVIVLVIEKLVAYSKNFRTNSLFYHANSRTHELGNSRKSSARLCGSSNY